MIRAGYNKSDPANFTIRSGEYVSQGRLLTKQHSLSRWLNADLTPTPLLKGGEQRTLTNLYNARPTWLDLAHRKLDEAVFAAYGWNSDLSTRRFGETVGLNWRGRRDRIGVQRSYARRAAEDAGRVFFIAMRS